MRLTSGTDETCSGYILMLANKSKYMKIKIVASPCQKTKSPHIQGEGLSCSYSKVSANFSCLSQDCSLGDVTMGAITWDLCLEALNEAWHGRQDHQCHRADSNHDGLCSWDRRKRIWVSWRERNPFTLPQWVLKFSFNRSVGCPLFPPKTDEKESKTDTRENCKTVQPIRTLLLLLLFYISVFVSLSPNSFFGIMLSVMTQNSSAGWLQPDQIPVFQSEPWLA